MSVYNQENYYGKSLLDMMGNSIGSTSSSDFDALIPMMYRCKPIEVQILPLKTIEEVTDWIDPGNAMDILLTVPPVCSHSKKVPLSCQPALPTKNEEKVEFPTYRTLVCHDHCNGYQDDRFCYGTDNRDVFRFYHWYGLDIFVYFSHNFVTIPPCGWVAAGHKHGVQVLGTLITEWESGTSVWEELLSTPEISQAFIAKMVEITDAYQFDGWFVNVENVLTAELAQKLLHFIEEFTNAIHLLNSTYQVIWYDSITINGDLDYQNELNDKNKPFFDVCDGIFLNYSWCAKSLANTVAAAGKRIDSVYVGIDVYCRSQSDGGGYGTVKQLSYVRQLKLSAGLFAVSWSYDKFGHENYFYTSNSLWNSYKPHLLYHGFDTLPFVTNFCQGFGRDYYADGKVEIKGPWYNLLKQQNQPIMEELSDTVIGTQTEDAFSGGSSLAIYANKDFNKFRLFLCHIQVRNLHHIRMTYKLDGRFNRFVVSFNFEVLTTESPMNLLCLATDEEKNAKKPENYVTNTPDKIVNGWTICTFDFDLPKSEDILSSIYINVDGVGVIQFGEMSIT